MLTRTAFGFALPVILGLLEGACSPSAEETKNKRSSPAAVAGTDGASDTGQDAAGDSVGDDGSDSTDTATTTDTGSGTNTQDDSGGLAIVGTLGVGLSQDGSSGVMVDKFLAVPVSGGEPNLQGMIESDVSQVGEVNLQIESSTNLRLADAGAATDFVFVLKDATQTEAIDQIVGFTGLTSSGGADTLIQTPIGELKDSVESLQLGAIAAPVGGEARGGKSVVGAAAIFDMTEASLDEMARTDGVLKGIKNAMANTHDNGVVYSAKPYFVFMGQNAAEIKNQYLNLNSVFLTAKMRYKGFGIYFGVVDPTGGSTLAQVCAASNATEYKRLALIPPAAVDDVDTAGTVLATYDASNRLSNNDVGTGGPALATSGGVTSCGGSTFYGRNDGDKTDRYAFNFGGNGYRPHDAGQVGGVVPGIWKLAIGGKVEADDVNNVVARFDMAAGSPLDTNGNPLIYVPSLKVSVDGSDNITKLEVTWWTWDKDKTPPQFAEVTDMTMFKRNTKNVVLAALDQTFNEVDGSSDASVLKGNVSTLETTGTFKFLGYDRTGTPAQRVATDITISYDLNGTQMRFTHRP